MKTALLALVLVSAGPPRYTPAPYERRPETIQSPSAWRRPGVRPPTCTPSRRSLVAQRNGKLVGMHGTGLIRIYRDDDGVLVVPPKPGIPYVPGDDRFIPPAHR